MANYIDEYEEMIRYRLLFEKSRDIILFVRKSDGHLIDANEAAVTAYGYSRENLLQLTVYDLRSEDPKIHVQAQMSAANEDGILFTTVHRRKNGSTFPVEVSSRGSTSTTGERYLLSIVRDISERTLLEKEKDLIAQELMHAEKLATLGTLASGIAHEINNPLEIIFLNNDIIKEQLAKLGTDSGITEILKKQQVAAERISDIVRGLKIFSRRNFEDSETVDVHRCIQEALSLTSFILSKTSIKLETHFCTEPAFVTGNIGKIQQIIINLLTNAKDALDNKGTGGIINFTTQVTSNGVELLITDNGQGIHPENLSRIFDPFFTTKSVGKGTGLGLSITKSLLASMGAYISVRSEVNQGTTFKIIFISPQ